MRATENPELFAKAVEAYCAGMAAGTASAELLASTGLSHAQAGLAWYEDSRNPAGIKRGACKGATDQDVLAMRLGTHEDFAGRKLSWGFIMVATDQAEGAVRNQFGRAANVAAEGTRIGKGGAWLDKEPRFYVGSRKRIGVEAPRPKALTNDERSALAKAALAGPVASVLPSALRGKAKAKARKATTARKAVAAAKATS